MKKFFKWVGIVFGAFIVIGIIASMGEDDSANTTEEVTQPVDAEVAESEEPKEEKKEEPKSFGLEEEVSVGNLSYTVHSVENMEAIKSGNQFIDDLTTSGKFVVVDLTVKNNDKEARYIDSAMFRLVEEDGTEYSPATDADMLINDGDLGFFLQEVNPKMDFNGKIAFEVPAEFTGNIQVSSGFGWSGGDYAEITYE